MEKLADKKCIPCSGGVPALEIEQRELLIKALAPGWKFTHEKNRLFKEFKFSDFNRPFQLAVQVSEMAEEQWHHPDINSVSYTHLTLPTKA